MVQERRGAPGGGHAEHRLRDPERPSSGLPGRPGLCAGGVLQPPLRKVPGVQLHHGAHAAVQRPERRGGAQRHRGARLHGRRPPSARRGRRTASLQYPHNTSTSSPSSRVLTTTRCATSTSAACGLPAPQLHCRLSHRARAQDAAE